jgi:hypothetical protein
MAEVTGRGSALAVAAHIGLPVTRRHAICATARDVVELVVGLDGFSVCGYYAA